MPMEFTYASCDQAHLDAGHRLGDGKFAHAHLAGPTAILDALVGKTEGVLEGLDGAVVGLGSPDGAWVLPIELGIVRAGLLFVGEVVIGGAGDLLFLSVYQ